MSSPPMRERLAALEHTQWAHWTEYMLNTLSPLMGTVRMVGTERHTSAVEALKRWMRQVETPYAKLTKKERDSDREWADKALHTMSGHAVVFAGSEAHHSLKDAGWAEADEQPLDNLLIMEW